MTTLTATAPTGHQYNSARFWGPVQQTIGGSYIFYHTFDSMADALDYVNDRIDNGFNEGAVTHEEAEQMKRDARTGRVQYDACTLVIEEE